MFWFDALFHARSANPQLPTHHPGVGVKIVCARTAHQQRRSRLITGSPADFHGHRAHVGVQVMHQEAVRADHERITGDQHGPRTCFTIDGDGALRAVGDHALAIHQLDAYRPGIDPLFQEFEDPRLTVVDRDGATNRLGRERFELDRHMAEDAEAGPRATIADDAANMPELPEVETVRRGLEPLLVGATIACVRLMRHDLRTAIPADFSQRLRGSRVTAIRRRAKYLLIDTTAATILSHLGMTGTWRLAPAGEERTHDHCYLELGDGRRLAFRDPRRFGQLDFVAPDDRHPSLDRLGPEPLGPDFTVDYLRERFAGRRQAVKVLIMDQAIVVGVGNIYAQEACFRAGLRPTLAAGSVSRERMATLIREIRQVLSAAIAAGGSTISDFRQAGGDAGYFQHDFQVYDRAGEPCLICAMRLRGKVLGGRSTVWCAQCQR